MIASEKLNPVLVVVGRLPRLAFWMLDVGGAQIIMIWNATNPLVLLDEVAGDVESLSVAYQVYIEFDFNRVTSPMDHLKQHSTYPRMVPGRKEMLEEQTQKLSERHTTSQEHLLRELLLVTGQVSIL